MFFILRIIFVYLFAFGLLLLLLLLLFVSLFIEFFVLGRQSEVEGGNKKKFVLMTFLF